MNKIWVMPWRLDKSRSEKSTAPSAARLATVRLSWNQPVKSVSHTEVIAAISINSGLVGSRWPMPRSIVPRAAMVAMLICNSRSRYTSARS